MNAAFGQEDCSSLPASLDPASGTRECRKCLGTPSSTATGFPGITTGFPSWDSGTRGTLVGTAAFLFSGSLRL